MAGGTNPLLSIVVAGRNDDYGKDFRERLFRTALHNAALFQAAGVDFEYLLGEWNPLPDRPLLSEEFASRVPHGRAVVIPAEIHKKYSLNPAMPFHEMAAKNAALRRAKGDFAIVTNADILFSEPLVRRIAAGEFARSTLYRAHRIDVKSTLTWTEIQNPLNQLPSGEGLLPPPPYLGAGGDFCLAARELWYALRGFNETIRFATRAKDWQFFLSATSQGAKIEFIGDVYHLDHDGGFRNTDAMELNDESVHFGKTWDIEFGLPVVNPGHWGFRSMRERHPNNNAQVAVLQSEEYFVSDEQTRQDREVLAWITDSGNATDTQTAVLFHAICAAQRERRRLICRLKNPRLLAALSGFDAVAARFSIAIHCNWKWPRIDGHSLHRFSPEPSVLTSDDWIVDEADDKLCIHAIGNSGSIDVLPKIRSVHEPDFNPLLSRRLLYAYLSLQNKGAERIVIYGAGGHTKALMRWGIPDKIKLVAIVDSRTLSLAEHRTDIDAFLLSSVSFESDMAATCKERGIRNVIALYGDWPVDIWTANESFIREEQQCPA